jgi:hypothetical protein
MRGRLWWVIWLPAWLGCATPPPPMPAIAPTPAAPLSLETMVQAARADGARRTGLAPGALQLVSAEALTWPSGALGCPQPDRSYTMALVPGYRIRLLADELLLDYHASRRGALLLCPPGQAQDAPANGPV